MALEKELAVSRCIEPGTLTAVWVFGGTKATGGSDNFVVAVAVVLQQRTARSTLFLV